MALEGPLGTLLVVAIWSVCPCMTAESLAYLLHRLVHRACILSARPFGKLTAKLWPFMLVAILAVTSAAPAHAQQFPRWEFFGGFSYANVNLGPQAGLFLPTDRNYYGLDLAVSFNPYKNIRLLLLDVGIQQGGSTSTSPPFHTDVFTSQALFGPQFTVRARKATGFAHALIGVTNTRLVEILPGGFGTVDAVRRTNLAFGFGGGMDVNWTRSIAVRVFQADYVPTRLSGTWEKHFRVSTGVVFRWDYTAGR